MEIYLDANATTPVLPQARAAALAVMAEDFGNPSSMHSAGLKARAILENARAASRRALGVDSGQIVFTSGATEGIQTAILSALLHVRERALREPQAPLQLLFGATEHKAVPEALRHWCSVLGIDLPIRRIPVGRDGRHDLVWLAEHAPRAGLVCTMAANNETGVMSDLAGISRILEGSGALWLVDCVQALGKIPLRLGELRIDYAPFSGHKLYAPKGTGLLYLRDGAPFTPLQAGGGQEATLRAGTENMPGIAALAAVMQELEGGEAFADGATLALYRTRLIAALQDSLPGLVFNAPPALCLPTTLNFSVPGLASRVLLDAFDAAGLRMSGGSACSAGTTEPSPVLQAMWLPPWQTESAVRLSFGAADTAETIDEACARIRACGQALRRHSAIADATAITEAPRLLTRLTADGACCYAVADPVTRRGVVIDPLPALTPVLVRWCDRHQVQVVAVLETHSHGDHASAAAELRVALGRRCDAGPTNALGWPDGNERLLLGDHSLSPLGTPGRTPDATTYILRRGSRPLVAFVGDTVLPGAPGRDDLAQSLPAACADSLRRLESAVGRHTLLLPGHDHDDRFACTLGTEVRLQTLPCGARADASEGPESVELPPERVQDLARSRPRPVLVDVREKYEQSVGGLTLHQGDCLHEQVPLSELIDALPAWLELPAATPVLFYCRSGNRSARAARALRRLGHARAWSLAGGLALWPRQGGGTPVGP